MTTYTPPQWPSSYTEADVRTREPAQAPTILIVEDEPDLNYLMCRSMRKMGYEVLGASEGAGAIELVRQHKIDLIVLDLLLPGVNGYQVCLDIRAQSSAPIIIMTALNRTEDIVQGLEAGADEYMIKPFSFADLAARIYALLRRIYWSKTERVPLTRTIQLHAEDNSVTIRNQTIQLSPTEFKLLHCLIQSAEQAVSRDALLMNVWGYRPAGKASILHTTIRRLREKIEIDPADPTHIITVAGYGYKFS